MGGKVEPLLIDDGVILWSCGDARLYDVPPNRAKQLGGWTVRGPFVLTRSSDGGMAAIHGARKFARSPDSRATG